MANTRTDVAGVFTAMYDVMWGTDKANGRDESIVGVMHRLLADIDCTFVVVQEHGPGGGWPVVSVTGRLEELDLFHARYEGDWAAFERLEPLADPTTDELAVHLPGGVDPRD